MCHCPRNPRAIWAEILQAGMLGRIDYTADPVAGAGHSPTGSIRCTCMRRAAERRGVRCVLASCLYVEKPAPSTLVS